MLRHKHWRGGSIPLPPLTASRITPLKRIHKVAHLPPSHSPSLLVQKTLRMPAQCMYEIHR